MKWEAYVDQSKLSYGILSITGPYEDSKGVRSLNDKDVARLFNSVKNGFLGWPVKSLVLARLALPVSPEIFRGLIEGLLALSTLKAIHFRDDIVASPALTDLQVRILAEEVGEAKYLESLALNVKDSGKISGVLGQMISDNKSLTSFSSTHRDDKHVFPVFLAALLHNVTLKNLELKGVPYSCASAVMSSAFSPYSPSSRTNHLNVFFAKPKPRAPELLDVEIRAPSNTGQLKKRKRPG